MYCCHGPLSNIVKCWRLVGVKSVCNTPTQSNHIIRKVKVHSRLLILRLFILILAFCFVFYEFVFAFFFCYVVFLFCSWCPYRLWSSQIKCLVVEFISQGLDEISRLLNIFSKNYTLTLEANHQLLFAITLYIVS